jgi:hypothetical protein
MVRMLLTAVATGFIVLGVVLFWVYPASARMAYTYLNSGYCPGDLRHVRNVGRACGKQQSPYLSPTGPNKKLRVNNSRPF